VSGIDPRIDAYIAKAPAFAQPVLTHLRDLLHRACPDIEETIKWGRPAFVDDGCILAVMSAFKAHAALTLWKMGEPAKEAEGMGQFGKLTSLTDLPDDAELVRLIQATAQARETAPPRPRKSPKPELPVPEELTAAFAGNAKAKATWDAFAPSHRREYSEWIGEAKRPETRAARVAQTLEWLAEGKQRNWKYQG